VGRIFDRGETKYSLVEGWMRTLCPVIVHHVHLLIGPSLSLSACIHDERTKYATIKYYNTPHVDIFDLKKN